MTTRATQTIRIKRVYDPPSRGDGQRVLVDRLWPRGLTKDDARIDRWAKQVAPSHELRKWFGHDPRKWSEFQKRYLKELAGNGAVDELIEWIGGRKATLVYAAKDTEHNHAVVLARYVAGRLK